MNTRLPQNIITKCRRKSGKVHITIEFDVEEDANLDKQEIQARLKYTEWLLPHLYTWADFDSYYTIELFCDSLRALGKGLMRWDNTLHSMRTGRRAIIAAEKLHKAYSGNSVIDDKSYMYWQKQHPIDFLKGNKRANRIWEVINKRLFKQDKERESAAWAYIHKYIKHFWD